MKRIVAATGAAASLIANAAAQPTPGGLGLQPPVSALAEEVHFFHYGILLPIITIISLFVLALLIWVVVRYNHKANPEPRKFSHNTLIEVIWTGVPILILLVIALPSFDLLYKEDVVPDGARQTFAGDGSTTSFAIENNFPDGRQATRAKHIDVFIERGGELTALTHRADYSLENLGDAEVTLALNEAPVSGAKVVVETGRTRIGDSIAMAPTMTLKVSGYQWGWSYAYPDFGDFEFTSNMATEDATTPELYKYEVDNRVVLPVGETVRITTSAVDVIHSWALPNFAMKIDAVPGRINETWLSTNREGVYYGQCSEICGIKHSFMPIAIEVVARPKFEAWVNEQREFAGLEPYFVDAPVKVAQVTETVSGEQE